MNTIILSATVFDVSGVLGFKFDPSKSDLYSRGRRVSRKSTLDGNSITEDYGFSHSDRTLRIVGNLTGAQIDSLNYLIEYHSSVLVSFVDGIYLAALENSSVIGTEATIKILIKEKLTS